LSQNFVYMSSNYIFAVSPIDGRYNEVTQILSDYFSEFALIKFRIKVECEYFVALAKSPEFKVHISKQQIKSILEIYQNFDEADAMEIKKIEKTTSHDVKAVEYFLRDKFVKIGLDQYLEFIHFALTSEDINNISFTLMCKDGVSNVVLPELNKILKSLKTLAYETDAQPFLSLTHGQTATPTTFGKEIAVFIYRLQRQIKNLQDQTYLAKFGGATGTWSAHLVAYPDFNWLAFAKKFIESFDLEFCPLTTQIVPAESLTETYDNITRINNILVDFTRDIWLYVMRGVLGQVKKEGEIGSSAMPHKINPINFENAEGNLQLANSLFNELGRQLSLSRMQRDLSGSTVIRSQSIPFANSIIGYSNILKGLGKIKINSENMNIELDDHWEVLSEGIQTILRSINYPDPYTALKDLTKGNKISKESIQDFVNKLQIEPELKRRILNLTPHNYIGLSQKLVKFLN
jgi:adenylosuccinate lyase